MPTQAKI